MENLYLGLSFVAQVLFAISAVPFYLKFKKNSFSQWHTFEWTWYIAEIFMIAGSVGLARYELLPGLIVNFIFLSLCLPIHFRNTANVKKLSDVMDEMIVLTSGYKKEEPVEYEGTLVEGSDEKH